MAQNTGTMPSTAPSVPNASGTLLKGHAGQEKSAFYPPANRRLTLWIRPR